MTTETDLFIDDTPTILSRSDMEQWARCPHSAHLMASGAASNHSKPAEVGSAVHEVIAAAVAARADEGVSEVEMREMIREGAIRSRPDIQPDVIRAAGATWSIVQFITTQSDGQKRSPDDILRFDGGKGAKTGQLGADLGTGENVVRLTCEVDLLMSTPSTEEIELADWKSGWRHWTAMDVQASFQFSFYAYLVLRNYPTINTVRVRVFLTRDGSATGAVEFRRKDMYALEKRIESTVNIWREHHSASDPADVPAWPSPDKCGICPAATLCRFAHEPAADVARDPEAAIRQLVVLDTAAGQLRSGLAKLVRANGEDFQFEGGLCFGANKPVKARAKVCDVYSIRGEEKSTEE